MTSNNFKYSDDNKRYHTYNYYLRHKYGKKVFKVPLNANFGCPNRDGTKGVGGCTYCSNKMSGDYAGNPLDDIERQYNDVRQTLLKKWSDAKCIPYFQAGTNTYAPLNIQKELFERALKLKDAVGLNISTRADCINEEIADMLYQISKKTNLEVELGLQTIYDSTAKRINRCHTYDDFLKGYNMLKERGIDVCVHIINGLPGETEDMMINTVQTVGALNPHGMKIHLLYIIKGTKMHKQYLSGEVKALERDEYVQIVCNQLERIPEDVVIERVTGDGVKEDLIAPLWSLKKFCVMNEIDKEMARRNSYQGILVGED